MPVPGGRVAVRPRAGVEADTLQRMSRFVTRTVSRAGRRIRPALWALAWTAGLWSALAWGWDQDRLTESAAKLSPRTQAAVKAMIQMADRAAAMPDERDRLAAVNGFFNQRVAFRDDIEGLIEDGDPGGRPCVDADEEERGGDHDQQGADEQLLRDGELGELHLDLCGPVSDPVGHCVTSPT